MTNRAAAIFTIDQSADYFLDSAINHLIYKMENSDKCLSQFSKVEKIKLLVLSDQRIPFTIIED